MGLIKRTWKGDLSLPKTFWIGWVLPSIIISALITTNYYRFLIVKSISISLPLSFFLTFGIPLFYLSYQIFMIVSIWRSSIHYEGKKIWGITAKSIAVVYLLAHMGIAGYTLFVISKIDTNDPGKNSENITKFLKQDPEYPFIGFWKSHCSDNFGLSIDKAGSGLYSVSFCGPGGCFKPGTYRPNTKIIGDPAYRVIDDRTIQVHGVNGYSIYKRCT